MQIHQIKPKNKTKKGKKIGRGGKRGTYCGRGIKGQRARAGTRKKKPETRELIKRYPKLRGYKFSPLSKVYAINVSALNKVFAAEEEVNAQSLVEKGLLGKSKRMPVKILGKGELEKPLTVKGCLLSKSAREKIEKAGGRVITKQPTTNDKNLNDKNNLSSS